MVTDYATTADIRALLGVSEEEIEDATINSAVFSTQLEATLDDMSPLLATNYAAIKLIPEVNRTPVQVKFLKTAALYAAYIVAYDMLTSMTHFAPERVTDGKAEFQRFDRWADLKEGLMGGINTFKIKTRNALAAVDSNFVPTAPATRLSIVSTGVAFNPVTGV